MFESSTARILLVQSEPVLAELTRFRLELLGYQIESVTSGGDATATIQKLPPSLVIVDTALPDGDGIEWIAQLRAEFSQHLPYFRKRVNL